MVSCTRWGIAIAAASQMTKKTGAQSEWEGEATMTKFTEDKKMTKLSAAHRGDKNPFFGRKLSAATRAKMSAAQRGDKHHYFGKKLSAAHRAKIGAAVSAALLGNKNFLGHRHSVASRAKMRAAALGKKRDARGCFVSRSLSSMENGQ